MEGVKKSGKSFEDLKLIAWIYASISENSKDALDNVWPFVTQALINTAPEMYPIMFHGFNNGVSSFVLACKLAGDTKKAYDNRKYLTDDVIQRFSVAGTAEECVEKVKNIAKLGIKTIWIRLLFGSPFPDKSRESYHSICREGYAKG